MSNSNRLQRKSPNPTWWHSQMLPFPARGRAVAPPAPAGCTATGDTVGTVTAPVPSGGTRWGWVLCWPGVRHTSPSPGTRWTLDGLSSSLAELHTVSWSGGAAPPKPSASPWSCGEISASSLPAPPAPSGSRPVAPSPHCRRLTLLQITVFVISPATPTADNTLPPLPAALGPFAQPWPPTPCPWLRQTPPGGSPSHRRRPCVG